MIIIVWGVGLFALAIASLFIFGFVVRHVGGAVWIVLLALVLIWIRQSDRAPEHAARITAIDGVPVSPLHQNR